MALGLLRPDRPVPRFVYAVVAALGWWRPASSTTGRCSGGCGSSRPSSAWPRAGIDYVVLADKGLGFVVLLLLAALCVGFAEEGMFRGIGVTVFRVNGFSEGRVALWSSVVFGAVHLTNALSTGGAAVGRRSRSASPATSSI